MTKLPHSHKAGVSMLSTTPLWDIMRSENHIFQTCRGFCKAFSDLDFQLPNLCNLVLGTPNRVSYISTPLCYVETETGSTSCEPTYDGFMC